MAKGKQAAMAERRRTEAARDHIDRLTTELAEAKIRARDAEARAARLEGIEAHLGRSSKANDELVVTLAEKNAWWAKVAKEDGKRRSEAVREMFFVVATDVGRNIDMGIEDRRQLLEKRYPKIMLALRAGTGVDDPDAPIPVIGSSMTKAEGRLSGESLRRFQRLCGHRTVVTEHPDLDTATVISDLLDAHQAGFSHDDVIAYATEGNA